MLQRDIDRIESECAEFLLALGALGLGDSLAIGTAEFLFLATIFADDESTALTLAADDGELNARVRLVVIDLLLGLKRLVGVVAFVFAKQVRQRHADIFTKPSDAEDFVDLLRGPDVERAFFPFAVRIECGVKHAVG